jgi:hypothetical protein
MIMKRYLLFILFAAVTFVANAQKSYLFVRADVAENTLYTIRLSGDIPASMSKKYSYKEIGEILNEISSNGFDMDYCFGGTSINMIFSKGDSNQSNAIQKIEADNDDVSDDISDDKSDDKNGKSSTDKTDDKNTSSEGDKTIDNNDKTIDNTGKDAKVEEPTGDKVEDKKEETKEDKTDAGQAKTGDGTPVSLLMICMVFSAAALMSCTIMKRRKQQNGDEDTE